MFPQVYYARATDSCLAHTGPVAQLLHEVKCVAATLMLTCSSAWTGERKTMKAR
jgi:hypothetical protein